MMAGEKILVVDDEKLVRWTLRQKCEEWGYQVSEAANLAEGLQRAQSESPDLVLLDVRLPDGNGMDALERIRSMPGIRAVIMMTADPSLDDVKAALKLGAHDFVSKPLNLDELSVTIENALETTRLRSEVESLRTEARRRVGYQGVVSVSPKMKEIMEFVRKVAASEAATVLIQGESGTGKDLIAKAIHYESSRHNDPFVTVNCSATPKPSWRRNFSGTNGGRLPTRRR
jgi:two-component system response regulator AtoC